MLLEEIKKLQKMRRTLKNAIDAVGTALSTECGVPWLEECPEEWYIATPAQGGCAGPAGYSPQHPGPYQLL